MTAIPIDIPLPLPGSEEALKLLLALTFIIHIFFVGLMIGGAYWMVIFRLYGRDDPFYEWLAKKTSDTVLVNKSLAVVLGVAPLLLIGLVYTRYWYSANIMTMPAFLSIVWLVIVAFLFVFAYKFTWESLSRRPFAHLSLGGVACAIFAIVPLIFLTNINLMLLPFKWDTTYSFVQALLLPNVLPRYLHFLTAVFAMIGFFAAIYFWYRGRGSDNPYYLRAQRLGLKWALTGTLLQGIFGTFLFVTLPDGSYSTTLFVLTGVAVAVAAGACIALIRALQRTTGASIIASVALLGVVAVLMSFMRHTVRENLLREPHAVAQERTRQYRARLSEFLETYEAEAAEPQTGEQLFKRVCSSCHAPDKLLVGPSLTHMVEKYKGKKEEMVAFVLEPKKVNPDLPSMPKPPIDRQQAERIVSYILTEGKEEAKPEPMAEEKKPAPGPSGEDLFERHCSVCHLRDKQLVGPPIRHMVDKYTGKKEEMVAFVLDPFKINPDLPMMPKHPISEEQARKIADYILDEKPEQ